MAVVRISSLCGQGTFVRIGHGGRQPLMTTALLSFPRLLFYASNYKMASPYLYKICKKTPPWFAPGEVSFFAPLNRYSLLAPPLPGRG